MYSIHYPSRCIAFTTLFEYGIKIMAFYQTISYNNAKLFEWLNDEVSNARRVGDKT